MMTLMRVRFTRLVGIAGFLLLVACASAPQLDTARLAADPIKNQKQPTSLVVSGGQPTETQLQTFADAGVKHVINLRGLGEYPYDEAAKVEALGMTYHAIPVAGVAGVTSDNARKLDTLLQSLEGQPVAVHCASGNRVGALVAIAQVEIHNQDIETAIAEGRRWGMTRLEKVVRKHLSP